MSRDPCWRWLSCSAAVTVAVTLGPAQPVWVFSPAAGAAIRSLWDLSTAVHQERVACLAGSIGLDTVLILAARALEPSEADSLTVGAASSLDECGPPEWIGTIHTHIQSTDDPSPSSRFSGQDRVVISLWASRWRRPGAFCVAYGPREAHCEVYPLRAPARDSAKSD